MVRTTDNPRRLMRRRSDASAVQWAFGPGLQRLVGVADSWLAGSVRLGPGSLLEERGPLMTVRSVTSVEEIPLDSPVVARGALGSPVVVALSRRPRHSRAQWRRGQP